nr:hypothetical protein [Allomuricauda sp.]
MIDFSCCEVEKAFKRLYGENGVHSISPIVKSYNQSFANDGKTVYYGAFANPNDVMNLSYRGMPVANTGNDILFDHVDGFLYDSFTGYEVRLKNALGVLDSRVVKIYLDDTNLNGWPVDVTIGGNPLSVGANEFGYAIVANGLTVNENTDEVQIDLDGGGATKSDVIGINEGNILYDFEVGEYYISIYLFGVS